MKKRFRKIVSFILIVVILVFSLPFASANTLLDNRYYWLYSSSFPAAWKMLSQMETYPTTVAVIDTGIDIENPHFEGRIDPRGKNFVSDDSSDIKDMEGHGTSISGIIAAIPIKEDLYSGACGSLDVKILALKVYNDMDKSLNLQAITDAIYYAVECEVDVINISIDIPYYDDDLQKACLFAYEKNITIVSPSGNKGEETYSFPSSFYGIISVAALSLYTDKYYLSSAFSTFNDRIDISAQGENIYTLIPGEIHAHTMRNGSSFSCAMVSAAVAILRAVNKNLTPYEITEILCSSADHLSDDGRNNYYGYGKLNALSALMTDIDSLSYQTSIDPADETDSDFTFTYLDHKETLACGYSFGLWLKTTNTVGAAGDTSFGKSDVSSWKNITSIAAGDSFALGVTGTGTVVNTGFSGSNALDTDKWSSVKQVSAGAFHSVAVTTTGSVLSAGSNAAGQCDTLAYGGIKKVECGSMHTVMLRINGTVRCAGSNIYNECDTGTWSDIVSIAAGDGFTLGLKSDGTVVSTGNNLLKQCDVSHWNGIIEIFAGKDYSMGLRHDGTVVYTGKATDFQETMENLTDIKTLACGKDIIIVKTNKNRVSVIGSTDVQRRSVNKLYVSKYDDISDDYWAAPYVITISRLGIINGVYSGTGYVYIPDVYMTRQEFLKVVIESMGISVKNIDADLEIFEDCQHVDEWAVPYVKAAYNYGYLKGDIDEQGQLWINPKRPLTRAQAFTILGRAFGIGEYSDIEYSDKDQIPEWAYEATAYFTSQNVLTGYPDNTVRPDSLLYRSEAATVVCRLYSYVLNTYSLEPSVSD